MDSPFLKPFGKPQRMDACEREGDNGSNMLQALHFINGKSILNRVQAPNGRPALLLSKKLSDQQMVTELYLLVAGAAADAREMQVSLAFLASHCAYLGLRVPRT